MDSDISEGGNEGLVDNKGSPPQARVSSDNLNLLLADLEEDSAINND